MFRNEEYGKQLKDFSGLKWGKISPTDIDGILEFSDKLYVIIETKYGGAPMPYGQQLALERLTRALNQPPRHAVLIVTSHNSHDRIDMANTKVIKYMEGNQWFTEIPEITCREMIEIMRRKYLG